MIIHANFISEFILKFDPVPRDCRNWLQLEHDYIGKVLAFSDIFRGCSKHRLLKYSSEHSSQTIMVQGFLRVQITSVGTRNILCKRLPHSFGEGMDTALYWEPTGWSKLEQVSLPHFQACHPEQKGEKGRLKLSSCLSSPTFTPPAEAASLTRQS